MKNILLFAFFLCSSFLAAQISVLVPPENVTMAFKKQYPEKAAIWSIEYGKNDKINFQAEFNIDSKTKAYAMYDSDGFFKSYRIPIPITKLPLNAQDYLSKNYQVKSIMQHYSVLDDKNGETYNTGIKINKELYRLVFSKEGELVARIKVKFI